MNLDEMVLYEDDDFIILNKPSGMLAIPDRFIKEKENLYDALNERYGKIFTVHRIDKDTSGIIIFAKNPEAHRDLSMKFENGDVSKAYYALVKGRMEDMQGVIDLPISPLRKKKGVMIIDKKAGKKAVTRYNVVEKYNGYTLVEVFPKTGRSHQIRVHFSGIGHPLAVDPLYNRPEAIGRGLNKPQEPKAILKKIAKEKKSGKYFIRPEEKAPIGRLPLHAAKIGFLHFRKNEHMEIEAPMPKDFKSAIDILSLQSFYNKKK